MIEWFFIKLSIFFTSIVIISMFFIVFVGVYNQKVYYVDSNLKYYFIFILLIIFNYIAYKSYIFFQIYEVRKAPEIVVKITGNQWYWNINYIHENINFNTINDFSIQASNNAILTLPIGKRINILVTSSDVIHGLFVPDLRINIEGIKGKINEQKLIFKKIGKYYGECNVLCGPLHSKMPIVLNIVNYAEYEKYIKKMIK